MRGSEAAGNPDGWGVAYTEEGDARILREPSPAVDSPLVTFLGSHGPASTTILSHVRRATLGARSLPNTQPFVRALGGQTHIFAHNGHVPSLEVCEQPWLQPIGDTDSERMFCLLLASLEPLWRKTHAPSLEARSEIITRFAEEMRSRGAANFVYFDGLTLFAHSHRRTVPGAAISTAPGLYLLHTEKGSSGPHASGGLTTIGACAAQAMVATMPLDDEGWQPLAEGELLRLEHGALR